MDVPQKLQEARKYLNQAIIGAESMMRRERIIEDILDDDDPNSDWAALLRDYSKTDDLIPAPILIRVAEKLDLFVELEAELEQHPWILVSERLPEQVSGHWGSKKVFATDGKQAWACKYNYSAEYWTAPSGDITHWKPIILPE